MDIEPINYRDWVKLPPPRLSLRERIFEFATYRYFDGARPEWFWLWLQQVTFTMPSVYDLKGLKDAGKDEDDIPF
jgi:hypothetical protein